MSKDNDYTFGQMFVSCDYPGCKSEETLEGMDNHPPSYADANQELREMGWTSKKVGGDWADYCDDHSKEPPHD